MAELIFMDILKNINIPSNTGLTVTTLTFDKDTNIIKIKYDSGLTECYKNGKLHNDFGPAIYFDNDNEHSKSEWWLNGERVTDEEQHVIKTTSGYTFNWRDKKNRFHRPQTGPFARDDHLPVDFLHPAEPALYNDLKLKCWYIHDQNNRDPSIGPSNDYTDCDNNSGYICTYWFNNMRHNPFGPAIVYTDKTKNEWYFRGSRMNFHGNHVTRIWIDQEKGYYMWKNERDEIHRPNSGPFARNDSYEVDPLHPAEPAMKDEKGEYYYTFGDMKSAKLYDGTICNCTPTTDTTATINNENKIVTEADNSLIQTLNSNNTVSEIKKKSCFCGKQNIEDIDKFNMVLSDKDTYVYHATYMCIQKKFIQSDYDDLKKIFTR